MCRHLPNKMLENELVCSSPKVGEAFLGEGQRAYRNDKKRHSANYGANSKASFNV